MSYFKFLDNRFKNLGLDNQITFDLKKDGQQQAAHQWVLVIRKFYKYVSFLILPFSYLLQSYSVIRSDRDYNLRYEEMKTYTEKTLKEARQAQQQSQPVPINVDRAALTPIRDATSGENK